MKEPFNKDKKDYQIGKYIDTLLKKQKKTPVQASKFLRQRYRLVDICRVLDNKIQNSPTDELVFLAVSLNRKQYLSIFLNYYGSNPSIINNFQFLSKVQAYPLTDCEEKILVQYINSNWQYDVRLLSLLSPPYLQIALDGITSKIETDGLKIKHIQALSYSSSHLAGIQDRIRDGIDSIPEWRKTWMPFLDLSILENQAVINKHYSIIEIHCHLRKHSHVYVDSQFVNIRIALQLIHQVELTQEDSTILKCYIIDLINSLVDLDEDRSIIDLLQDAARTDKGFAEALLITLYKKTKVYTKIVLDALLSIGSEYAYKEMVSLLLSTTSKRKKIPIALQLLNCYPHKANAILDYAKSCNDVSLIKCIESNIAKLAKQNAVTCASPWALPKEFSLITPETERNELLKNLAISLKADTFFASVGFVFSSGLSLLSPVLDYITEKGGKIELILGSLQNFKTANAHTKIDKHTVIHLNKLIETIGIKLYTYEDAFYHGKFYYLSGKTKAAVIIGSTNISKTAFFDNYELDVLIPIDLTGDTENSFLKWYHDFKKQCTPILYLDENMFTELNWDSELSVYNEHFVKLMPTNDIIYKIQQLNDSVTKRRMENWMRHNPSLCLSVHNITALNNYVMFVYKDKRLAAFETFELNNAYYVFDCDDYGQLIERLSTLSKDEMVKLNQYKRRGYHIQDQDRLTENIDFYFR